MIGLPTDIWTRSLTEKHTLFSTPEPWKLHCRALKFQNFLEEYATRPPPPTCSPKREGTNGLLFIQSVATLFKPAGYFNCFWNPCIAIINLDLFVTSISYNQPKFQEETQPTRKLTFICLINPFPKASWTITLCWMSALFWKRQIKSSSKII